MICYLPSMPCYPQIMEGAYNLADLPTEALNCEEVQPVCSSPTFPDQYWLQRWIHLIRTSPHTPRVPPDACHITTPLIVTAWRHLLLGHSHRDLVHFLLTELSQGFRLGYTQTTSTLKSARRNMHSALFHPEVVDQYLPAQLAEHQLWVPIQNRHSLRLTSVDLGLYQKGTSLTNGGELWIRPIPKVGASTMVSPKSSVQCRTLQLTMHR